MRLFHWASLKCATMAYSDRIYSVELLVLTKTGARKTKRMTSDLSSNSPEQAITYLNSLKQTALDEEAHAFIRKTLTKSNEASTYTQAFSLLYQRYEEMLQQATIAAFGLNDFQAKKILYKKDRIRLFKKHGIDFNALAGADAMNTLSLIVNASHYEGLVTEALADKFPYWKEGFAMVQLDQAYKKLVPQCIEHQQALLDALINVVQGQR